MSEGGTETLNQLTESLENCSIPDSTSNKSEKCSQPSSPAHNGKGPHSDTNGPASCENDSKGESKRLFSEQFKLFSKFGDTKSDGKLLSLSQSDKWMKQAKVIDGKSITTTDTGIHFKKLKSLKVGETEYKKFLCDLAKTRKMDVEEIKAKMINCGSPGLTTTAVGGRTPSAVERLTDPSKYTGSHKQRFDESGRGRGIAGRKDLVDNSGYVSGYHNKNTYDKTHPTQ